MIVTLSLATNRRSRCSEYANRRAGADVRLDTMMAERQKAERGAHRTTRS